MVVKYCRFSNRTDIAIAQIHGGLWDDIEQGFHFACTNPVLMTDGLTDVSVPDAKVAGIGTGKYLADKLSAGSHRQVE